MPPLHGRLTGVAGAALAVLGLTAASACSSAAATRNTAVTVSDEGHPATVATDQGTTPAPPSAAGPATAVGDAVSFAGVTVAHATDPRTAPVVTGGGPPPAGLVVQDVVVGTGAPAAPTATVALDYVGVLLADGQTFESTWSGGGPTTYRVDALVPGMLLGIGGTPGVTPMRVGGRRILVFPAALGYGGRAAGPIPAGSALAFVVDLRSVS